jgi:hypothetical protein
MNVRVPLGIVAPSGVVGWRETDISVAQQDSCQRLHRCPSDHHTYVCGDKGGCEQCPDH